MLLLGEGDFGFTRALLRRSSGLRVIATSLESEQQLSRVYPGVQTLLSGLRAIGERGKGERWEGGGRGGRGAEVGGGQRGGGLGGVGGGVATGGAGGRELEQRVEGRGLGEPKANTS